MTHLAQFNAAFATCPLVAILRGVHPNEIEAIGEALVDAGFTLIEVPFNSPDPLVSIERLATRLGARAVVGAGTVLAADDVVRIRDAAGQMIISPNMNPSVIAATTSHGLISLPGVATPTEAFAAIEAGATALKFFPAEAGGPKVLKAMRAVLPPQLRVLPVGGITVDTMDGWLLAGANGFGLGSALYVPGRTAAEVGTCARRFVSGLTEGAKRRLPPTRAPNSG